MPAWRLGAVQFFSPTAGVGLTASSVVCFRRTEAGNRDSFEPQPVRLALTNDGGHSWRLIGAAAPIRRTPWPNMGDQLVAASARRVWAIVGNGGVLTTTDGGRSWRRMRLPGPAVELIRAGADVWMVTCPPAPSRDSPLACRPRLWRASIGTGTWKPVLLPELAAQEAASVRLALSSDQRALLNLVTAGRRGGGEMAISLNAGRSWRIRADPRWDRSPCSFGAGTAAAKSGVFWLLCIGGAAAGSSTKGLAQSTDSGATWHTVSAVTSLTRQPAPGSLPLAEPGFLAAGSAQRLWLSTTNWLVESNDGGRIWREVPGVFSIGGWPTTISVLDARHAWLLAPGAGMWSTSDGRHWAPIRPLHTR